MGKLKGKLVDLTGFILLNQFRMFMMIVSAWIFAALAACMTSRNDWGESSPNNFISE
jgi:hypothetical protein